MKFIVAGQKKESWFYNKKNRLIYAIIAPAMVGFILPLLFEVGEVYDWKSSLQLFGLLVFIEILYRSFNKEEKAEGLVSIDFKDNSIELTYFSGEAKVLAHDQIQAIHKDVSKIVIDVKNKKEVYGIPYSYFEYEQIQNIKSEVDKVSKKISVPPIQNPTFS